MNLSFGLSQSLEQRQEQRLTQEQRLAVETVILQRRRDLVEALHDEKFDPRGTCPKCSRALTDYEIMKGFKDDPTDYTTSCPKCHCRFLPRLYSSRNSGSVEMAFFCPSQTLGQMEGLQTIPLDEFRTKHAEVYNSAVVHFGGLKQAFAKLGLKYAFEADLDWKSKVSSFLGKLPDTVIAELVGAQVSAVRKLRKDRGIATYSRREDTKDVS